ncbi:uncharacterized protein LOC128197690 [Vigna angularis]|uniref:uncharacterized protein LOC128197690 n=1 Tax=Phaseolus angularis TaxID=3914 RepID=UPI0022B411FE|nr:uncharacterized protein LOC128197690 [Vigna angularis]
MSVFVADLVKVWVEALEEEQVMVVGAFLKPLPPKTPFYGLRLNWARVSPLAPIFFATTKHFHFFRNKHFVDGSINLKTCKNCKTQFDLSLNHPLACRFHTAHFEGLLKRWRWVGGGGFGHGGGGLGGGGGGELGGSIQCNLQNI